MQPFVELIHASKAPAPPAGTRPGWAASPDTFDFREQVPVLVWGGYLYWTFEYLDNRMGFAVVASDHAGSIVKQWEKQGPRYIWDITLELGGKSVTFWGQENIKLVVKLEDLHVSIDQYYSLYPPPVINLVPFSEAPAVPPGLFSFWQLDSHPTARQSGIPVLAFEDHTYRVYEYPDNRTAFALIAFNKDGKIVTDWELQGARHITNLVVDLQNKRVNFTGQSDKTVTRTWDELRISGPGNDAASSGKFAQMEVKEVDVKTAPAIPGDLEMERTWTTGPNAHNDSKYCTVLLYQGNTYWAFDNQHNENSIGIVAYDSNGNLVKHWKKPGTRYLWSVSVDPRRKTVTFWGQANQTVVMGWDELKV
ncbi:hypothetical protein EWM62_04880 [Mucilaginibacter terrigena]|uniref:Uncharacterized protein n=1 Tax=Mucilaginibacter terrigena TaxID=2492395 RepID=A0A4Q5LPD6_9SPHI|nr:hypothetical protein [Mucilaginibacter terrigena]RYU91278.1 hypothetical protein EWM62_04880 [Mucilaginibacter terrigena]